MQAAQLKEQLGTAYEALRSSAAGQISFGGSDQDQHIMNSHGADGIFAEQRADTWRPLQLLAAVTTAARRALAWARRSSLRPDPRAGAAPSCVARSSSLTCAHMCISLMHDCDCCCGAAISCCVMLVVVYESWACALTP